MKLLDAIGSQPGRAARVAAGLSLIGYGLTGKGRRRVLAAAGLVPFVAGAADICLLGPLAGRPLSGPAFRQSGPAGAASAPGGTGTG